jgi:hypothetical protein
MPESQPAPQPIVYWHRQLPPVTADVIENHAVEATSARVVALADCGAGYCGRQAKLRTAASTSS